MDADLQPVYDRVMQASRTEDIFRVLTVLLPPRLLEKHLAEEVVPMRVVLDPEKYSSMDDREAASTALARLEDWYEKGIAKAGKGLYALDDFTAFMPARGSKSITVDGVSYAVGEKFHIGEHSSIHRGRLHIDGGTAGVVIRVANTPDDNPYLFNEIRMLDMLHREDVGYWKNVPFMLGRFNANDRIGIVYRYFDGLTLGSLRADPLHKNGLDQRHAVWVMDRMLGLMWYYHVLGIVHGRIEPERVRVRPSNHNVMLTGWGHALYNPAQTGERIHPLGGVFEAPEIRDSGKVGPWTDIYSLGKTLIWLLGGDPVTNEMPDHIEPKIRQFLLNMVPKNPRARPHDAQQLYRQQNRLKDSLWERRFIHLNVTQQRS